MIDIFKKIAKKHYYPLNNIKVSGERLSKNYEHLCSINKKVKVAPVIKGNAYGHGIVQVAKILDQKSPPFFCVDSLYEAYLLLKVSIESPILIMGYVNPLNLQVKKLPFSYAIYDLNLANALNKFQPGTQVHIKVDTGMHRLGVLLKDLPDFLNRLKKLHNIKIVGLMSHLASVKGTNDKLAMKQIEDFKIAKRILHDADQVVQWTHLASTSGLLNVSKKISELSNVARVGLALYGIDKKSVVLKPVLKLTSKIIQMKTIKKGEKVGYDGTFTAKEEMLIGILPIGYSDGVDLRLSNKGKVLVRNQNCDIIGNVSMNITTISLQTVKKPHVGEQVVIYSDNHNDINSVENAARICDTIPYEILAHLSPTSIRREMV